MSFRDDSEDGRGDIRKPFLHTGSWYRMSSRQSSMMGSSQAIRDNSISVVACVLIVALGPIQFGFTVSNLSSTSKHFFFLDCFFYVVSFLFVVWLLFTNSSFNNGGSWTHSIRGLVWFDFEYVAVVLLFSLVCFWTGSLKQLLFVGLVLFIWFTVKCGCYGWCYSQWSNCGVYWTKRGMIEIDLCFFFVDYIAYVGLGSLNYWFLACFLLLVIDCSL